MINPGHDSSMDQSFYHALRESDEFSAALGKLVLSSARLESSLKAFIDAQEKVDISDKASLGRLINTLLKNHAIDRTAGEQLQFILHQRNHFVHKLHTHLSLYPQDSFKLKNFINRVNGLASEMEWFSDLLASAVESR